ncbi:hypothetical protein ILUMI_25625 [Ignelater luminosus]|uniref:F-box domain-containing protein n=1 Tax=Ignelater luminosus TaxID=2038154 RepID=A0A8K0C5A5_IGNLU|nr:hypothetical protein ILUMI_25625 [Ignelater luminosus]
MDFTPHQQDASEDSGCLTGPANTPLSFSGGSSSTYYNETPVTVSSVSRKRKLSNSIISRLNRQDLLESLHGESSFDNDAVTSSKFLSSTLNESLSKSLEKCNIRSPNNTSHLYLERSPDRIGNEQSLKRYKLDDSPKYQPKTRSAPSTPTKHLDLEELSCLKGKSRSEHLNVLDFTPVKSSLYPRSRLGSPERIELLYPNLKVTPSPLKLKTPEKLLKNDFRHVVSKIFEYLSDSDLCTVSKVSKTWKKALFADHKAFPRYYSYFCGFNSNKENIAHDVSSSSQCYSPPASPARDSFHKCTRIAAQLLPNQSLQKCIRCMEPAVIQRNISQCQNPYCEYIHCTKCLSFSITGPQHFIDRCQTSRLLVDNQKSSLYGSRFGLYDISNGGNDPPSFLLSDSPKNTPSTQSKYDSSGYLSGNDISPVIKQNINVHSGVKSVLASRNTNKIEKTSVRRKHRRSSLVSVVSASSTPKIIENVEPSSPPRREHVACSKQSKKNLKRLHF